MCAKRVSSYPCFVVSLGRLKMERNMKSSISGSVRRIFVRKYGIMKCKVKHFISAYSTLCVLSILFVHQQQEII